MLARGPRGNGYRRYHRHLVWIVLVTRLRSTGMPIREVRGYAELVPPRPATRRSGSAMLGRTGAVAAGSPRRQDHLGAIDRKIRIYDGQARAGVPA